MTDLLNIENLGGSDPTMSSNRELERYLQLEEAVSDLAQVRLRAREMQGDEAAYIDEIEAIRREFNLGKGA
jgi:hypothetical protein